MGVIGGIGESGDIIPISGRSMTIIGIMSPELQRGKQRINACQGKSINLSHAVMILCYAENQRDCREDMTCI